MYATSLNEVFEYSENESLSMISFTRRLFSQSAVIEVFEIVSKIKAIN